MHREKVILKLKEWIDLSVVHTINSSKYNLGLSKIARRELPSDFSTVPRFQWVRDLLLTPDEENNSFFEP